MQNHWAIKTIPVKMVALLKIIIILCLILSALFFSLTKSINIPTYHLNGEFQTASGLYRLDAGQFPGKDFYPYLGIGPLYVLYPVFKAFGGNIAASVFSARFMVLIVGMLSVAFIWHLIWRSKSFLTSLVAGIILMYAGFGFIEAAKYLSLPLPEWIISGLSWYIHPGNSLRPLRSAIPYLTAIILYFYVLRIRAERIKYIFAGVLTGATLLWSNDFAIPTAGFLGILVLLYTLILNGFQIKNIFIFMASIILTWFTLLVVATHGHFIELMRYYFIDVSQDQWWVFGPYGENKRIFIINQLTRLFIEQANYIPLLVIVFSAVLVLRTRLFEHALLLWIGIVLFAGGVLPSIGGHLGDYFIGFSFWGIMAIIAGFSRFLWLRFHKTSFPQTTVITALVLLFISMFIMTINLYKYRSELSSAQNDSNRFFVAELGGYLPIEWNNYIILARDHKQMNVFEEYWGLLSAIRRTFSAWPVDSAIHALGHTREIAIQQLQRADMVISTRYSTSPEWQPWNLSQNYWFYENLIKGWSISFVSPSTIVWRKNDHVRPSKAIECAVHEARAILKHLNFEIPTPGFYEVDIEYKSIGSGRFLIMIKNNINYAMDSNGYVSLNPKATRVKFPVYFRQAGPAHLDIKVVGNNEARVDVKSCGANYLAFNDEEVLRKPEGFILVPSTRHFIDQFKSGRLVVFTNGDTREITRVEPNGKHLNVFVSGDPLDYIPPYVLSKLVVIDKAN